MTPPASHWPFLRSIIAAPRDDAPRLVYADFLEENGEEGRAAYIRRTVAEPAAIKVIRMIGADRWDGQASDIRMRAVWAIRYRDLSRRDAPGIHFSFLPPAELFAGGTCIALRRGFVHRVETTAAAWLASGHLFAWHPLAGVRLSDRQPRETGPPWGFWWERPSEYRDQECTADCFEYMTGGTDTDSVWRRYDTRQAALSAMSRACIRRARQQAGFYPPAPAAGHATAHARNPEGRGAPSGPPAPAQPA